VILLIKLYTPFVYSGRDVDCSVSSSTYDKAFFLHNPSKWDISRTSSFITLPRGREGNKKNKKGKASQT
jgi:hypothetical protein